MKGTQGGDSLSVGGACLGTSQWGGRRQEGGAGRQRVGGRVPEMRGLRGLLAAISGLVGGSVLGLCCARVVASRGRLARSAEGPAPGAESGAQRWPNADSLADRCLGAAVRAAAERPRPRPVARREGGAGWWYRDPGALVRLLKTKDKTQGAGVTKRFDVEWWEWGCRVSLHFPLAFSFLRRKSKNSTSENFGDL